MKPTSLAKRVAQRLNQSPPPEGTKYDTKSGTITLYPDLVSFDNSGYNVSLSKGQVARILGGASVKGYSFGDDTMVGPYIGNPDEMHSIDVDLLSRWCGFQGKAKEKNQGQGGRYVEVVVNGHKQIYALPSKLYEKVCTTRNREEAKALALTGRREENIDPEKPIEFTIE